MAGMSSAVRGLIPKSTGGRMALGAGGALGMAAGVAGYRRRQANQRAQAAYNANPAYYTQQAANLAGPEYGDYMRQRIAAGNFPTL